MSEDAEPPENISGGPGSGGVAATFEPGDAETRAEAVVDRLGGLYWQKTYGGQDAFECLVRTVLSQNTSDVASQPAHDALMARYGPDGDGAGDGGDGVGDGSDSVGDGSDSAGEEGDGATTRDEGSDDRVDDLAENLAAADHGELADAIRHAGLYNQKAETLIRLAERVCEEYGGAEGFDAFVKDAAPATVREALLDMGGVGPKTADCVLLFSGGRSGVFPVDTHVHRIYRRLGIAPPDADHEGVRAVLEAEVPAEKCGFGHTASIQFGREYCTARKPACLEGPEACPLYGLCERVGVDEVTGEVVDPAEAVD